jgi:ethanolaminephosphotransferase
MRQYQYRCNDYSWLTPVFKRWVISPLIQFVPWSIPANIITLLSNFFVYLGLFLSLKADPSKPVFALLISACLLIYLIGDHLDGMQAKRTGTGSALGEFCDHYLDSFNNGIIVYTLFNVFGISNGVLLSGAIAISYLAHMAVFYEQFKTGWLTFEKVGSLEGVLLSAILIALSGFGSFHSLMVQPIVADFTLAEIFVLSSAVGAFLTFIQTFKRTPGIENGYWLYTALMLLLSLILPFILAPYQVVAILTLYASLYIGRLMYGHLIDGIERQTDFVVPLIFIVAYALIPNPFLFSVMIVYLIVMIVILIIRTFSVLGVYWVWHNVRN